MLPTTIAIIKKVLEADTSIGLIDRQEIITVAFDPACFEHTTGAKVGQAQIKRHYRPGVSRCGSGRDRRREGL